MSQFLFSVGLEAISKPVPDGVRNIPEEPKHRVNMLLKQSRKVADSTSESASGTASGYLQDFS